MNTCAIFEIKGDDGELHGLNVRLLTRIKESLINKGITCTNIQKGCAADSFNIKINRHIISVGMFWFLPPKDGRKMSCMQCFDMYPWYKTIFWGQSRKNEIFQKQSISLQNIVEMIKIIIQNDPCYVDVKWVSFEEYDLWLKYILKDIL